MLNKCLKIQVKGLIFSYAQHGTIWNNWKKYGIFFVDAISNYSAPKYINVPHSDSTHWLRYKLYIYIGSDLCLHKSYEYATKIDINT